MTSEQITYLKTGDKVRNKQTGEAGEIVRVIDEEHAEVEFFDGRSECTNNQLITFVPNAQNDAEGKDEQIQFQLDSKTKDNKTVGPTETYQSLNDRKNQFSYELDLHADQLFDDTSTRHPSELLPLQLSRLRQYLNQAIELRVQRVYIIHGVGSGRLKSEVQNMLSQNPKVKSYSNEYNPKYGMGATEVRFQ